jgi:hypothetical protein
MVQMSGSTPDMPEAAPAGGVGLTVATHRDAAAAQYVASPKEESRRMSLGTKDAGSTAVRARSNSD